MADRRAVILVTAALALAAPACGAGDPDARADPAAPADAAVATAPTASAPAAASTAPAPTPVSGPATVSSTADRVDEPLTIHWIGGSDVAWDEYSLPDELLADMPSFGERPLVMRTSIVQAVMPVEMRRLLDDAVAGGADAVVMSINPVWVHWDVAACLDTPRPPHEFYECLLTPVSDELTAQRAGELSALFTAAAGSGVPVYAYTQPHSAEVLSNPAVAPAIEAAEAALAAFDPGVPTVRFRSRIYTRDTAPMREGVEFFDMVHPTPAGAAVLTDWLAADLADFWQAVGLTP